MNERRARPFLSCSGFRGAALAALVSLTLLSCSSLTAPPDSPTLIAPARGQLMDNGCPDCSEPVKWHFQWTEVPDASEYHLYVIGAAATLPLIDERAVPFATYSYVSQGTMVVETWTWKVRAKVHGVWSAWGEGRAFGVEPVCQDCSSARSSSVLRDGPGIAANASMWARPACPILARGAR